MSVEIGPSSFTRNSEDSYVRIEARKIGCLRFFLRFGAKILDIYHENNPHKIKILKKKKNTLLASYSLGFIVLKICRKVTGRPMGTQQRPKHLAKAKAAQWEHSQGQGTSSWAHDQGQGMHVAKPKAALMGTQPRPSHAIDKAKTKARRHGHIAKGKVCMLPRPRQPHGHAAVVKACMLPRPR